MRANILDTGSLLPLPRISISTLLMHYLVRADRFALTCYSFELNFLRQHFIVKMRTWKRIPNILLGTVQELQTGTLWRWEGRQVVQVGKWVIVREIWSQNVEDVLGLFAE